MRFRFSIRDLFWMVLVVALALGWWSEHRRWIAWENDPSLVIFKPLTAPGESSDPRL
jgi:hypothetical protein